MNDIHSDDEQIQALKRWWDDNGTSLILTICVVLAGITGWNWWQGSQAARVESSFSAFNQLVNEVGAVAQSGDDIRIAQADYMAEQIKAEYGDSMYASFAAFLKARQAMQDGEFEAAVTELQWVIEQSPTDEVWLIAKYRLAKAYMAQEKFDAALTELQVADAGGFAMAYEEFRGDILMTQQKYADANQAYQAALEAITGTDLRPSPLLEEKISYSASFL